MSVWLLEERAPGHRLHRGIYEDLVGKPVANGQVLAVIYTWASLGHNEGQHEIEHQLPDVPPKNLPLQAQQTSSSTKPFLPVFRQQQKHSDLGQTCNKKTIESLGFQLESCTRDSQRRKHGVWIAARVSPINRRIPLDP